MQFKNFTAAEPTGRIIAGGSVRVYTANTSTPVTIFDEDDNTLTQPLTTSAKGAFGFAVANGSYDIEVTNGAQISRIENEQFFDISDVSTGSDGDFVTGTAGTANRLLMWNGDGDAVEASGAVFDTGDNTLQTADGTRTISFATYSDMIGTALTYTDAPAGTFLHVEDGDYTYKVAASGATDEHLTTTGGGGLKLYVQPDSQGAYTASAFGLVRCVLESDGTPPAGAVDNEAAHAVMEAALRGISESTNDVVTIVYDGPFAVGFSGTGQNYNTSCRVSAPKIRMIGASRPAVIALPSMDATVIRTWLDVPADSDFTNRVEYLELVDFVADGNWSEQTWSGPTGLEGSGIYDQNGLGIYSVDKVVSFNSGAQNCGQDGFPHADTKEIQHYHPRVENTGKGCMSMFNPQYATIVDAVIKNSNSSPDPGTKAVFTLASDGYAGLTIQEVGDYDSTGRSQVTYVRPRIMQEDDGSGILAASIVGTENVNVRIVYPEIYTASKPCVNFSGAASGGGVGEVIGGTLTRESGGRAISATNWGEVYVKEKTKAKQTGATATNIVLNDFDKAEVEAEVLGLEDGTVTLLLDSSSGTAVIKNSEIDAIALTLDTAYIYGNRITGSNLSFSSITTPYAWNNDGGSHPISKPDEISGSFLKSGTSVAAGGFESISIPVTGCTAASRVVTVQGTSSTLENFTFTTPRCVTDAVEFRLYNPSGSSEALGSGTFYAIVRREIE